jgi:hypothetical protein
VNNIAACNYDGGDCCGENVRFQFCNQDSGLCKCIDPKAGGDGSTQAPGGTPTQAPGGASTQAPTRGASTQAPVRAPTRATGGDALTFAPTKSLDQCPEVSKVGDGTCDVENVALSCGYDLGDCCVFDQVSDGECDVYNNNPSCGNYDGGDCCGPNANYELCDTENDPFCACLDPAQGGTPLNYGRAGDTILDEIDLSQTTIIILVSGVAAVLIIGVLVVVYVVKPQQATPTGMMPTAAVAQPTAQPTAQPSALSNDGMYPSFVSQSAEGAQGNNASFMSQPADNIASFMSQRAGQATAPADGFYKPSWQQL